MFTRKIITKKISVSATASVQEIASVFGQTGKKLSGYLKQVIIYKSSGAATEASSFIIAYNTSTDDPTNVIYEISAEAFDGNNSFVDSAINAPFSLLDPTIAGGTSYNQDYDLIIKYQADAAGELEIRLDFEVY